VGDVAPPAQALSTAARPQHRFPPVWGPLCHLCPHRDGSFCPWWPSC